MLKENPRKGVCSFCGKKIGDGYFDADGKPVVVKKTDMHHFAEYHDDDPLKDTIELCPQCHMYETWKARRKKQNLTPL